MNAREAWLVVLMLTFFLLLALAVAGAVSEWLAPEVQRTIGEAWTQ